MGKRKLGRGIQALLGMEDGAEAEAGAATAVVEGEDTSGEWMTLALADLDANPYQPRREYNPEELAALAQSIAVHGIIQPIVVRPHAGRFQIVAGERRYRAAREAGLSHIPARVVEIDDQQTFEYALIENLQRRDLNPVEKAQAFQDYIGRYGATHEELASQLGVDRSTVTNLIRLLELPEAVRDAVRVGQITFGHARALLSLADPVAQMGMCRKIIAETLSVRQVETMVKEQKERGDISPAAESPPSPKPVKSNHLMALENNLRQRLGTKVEIKAKAADKGVISIHFASHDEFERVMEILGPRAA